MQHTIAGPRMVLANTSIDPSEREDETGAGKSSL